MIFLLISFLESYFDFTFPSAFTYVSTRMLLSALTTLGLTIGLGPFFIRKLYAWKVGQTIRSSQECPVLAELHKKKKQIPTMGGILIIASLCFSLFLWMDLSSGFTLLLLLTSLWLAALGAWDDFLKLKKKNSKGLSAKKKLYLQVLLGSLIALYLLWPSFTEKVSEKTGITPPSAKEEVVGQLSSHFLDTKGYISHFYLPFFKKAVAVFEGGGTFFLFGWIVFMIVGSSNAVNLTDGLDGLASGCVVMVATVLALFAFLSNHLELARYLNILYIEGSGEIAVFLLSLAGACLGFLWYNGHPAQVFMGDTGSLFLGGVLGLSAVLLRREVILAIVGGIFVIEALSVLLQVLSYRYRNKKRVFLCAPLHHHFEYKGWPETKVVIRFWIINLILAILSVASLKFQ